MFDARLTHNAQCPDSKPAYLDELRDPVYYLIFSGSRDITLAVGMFLCVDEGIRGARHNIGVAGVAACRDQK